MLESLPSLKELCMKADTEKLMNDTKQEKRHDRGINTHFYVFIYIIWKDNIHTIIKIIHNNNVVT